MTPDAQKTNTATKIKLKITGVDIRRSGQARGDRFSGDGKIAMKEAAGGRICPAKGRLASGRWRRNLR